MWQKNDWNIRKQLITQINENEKKYLFALKNNEDNEILKSLRSLISNLRNELEQIENLDTNKLTGKKHHR